MTAKLLLTGCGAFFGAEMDDEWATSGRPNHVFSIVSPIELAYNVGRLSHAYGNIPRVEVNSSFSDARPRPHLLELGTKEFRASGRRTGV